MTKQPLLFELSAPPAAGQLLPSERAIATCPPEDLPRLNKQCQAILERLQRGPATNSELDKIALNYTARISDLRQAGWRIDCKAKRGGLSTYTLKGRR